MSSALPLDRPLAEPNAHLLDDLTHRGNGEVAKPRSLAAAGLAGLWPEHFTSLPVVGGLYVLAQPLEQRDGLRLLLGRDQLRAGERRGGRAARAHVELMQLRLARALAKRARLDKREALTVPRAAQRPLLEVEHAHPAHRRALQADGGSGLVVVVDERERRHRAQVLRRAPVAALDVRAHLQAARRLCDRHLRVQLL
ncbi:hypothetical protein T492DRAFT_932065, partial [Pavlovales sp. CCMP2436]